MLTIVKQIKVLYIILSDHIAGTEMHVLELASELNADKRFKISVLCCGGELAKEFQENDVEVFTMWHPGRFDIKAIGYIYKIIKKEQFDIVHAHLGISGLLGRIAAKLAGIKVIVFSEHLWCSYNEEYSYLKNTIHLFIYYLLSLVTDKIIAVSGAVKTFLVANANIPGNKIVVVNNCLKIKAEKLTENYFRTQQHIQKDDILLGIVGRLEIEKGHRYLFEAMKYLQNSHVKLVVIGSGSREQELKNYVYINHLNGCVIFTGFFNQQELQRAYDAMDILVMPSMRETFGLVALEAMWRKKPVIAFDVGGISEVVLDDVTGLLVEPKNSLELAHAINRLSDNANLRIEMGLRGYERAKNSFSYQHMINSIKKIYFQSIFKESAINE